MCPALLDGTKLPMSLQSLRALTRDDLKKLWWIDSGESAEDAGFEGSICWHLLAYLIPPAAQTPADVTCPLKIT